MTLFAAVVQMTSRDQVQDNLERTSLLVASAAQRGAALVVLPENFALMCEDPATRLAAAETLPGQRV